MLQGNTYNWKPSFKRHNYNFEVFVCFFWYYVPVYSSTFQGKTLLFIALLVSDSLVTLLVTFYRQNIA